MLNLFCVKYKYLHSNGLFSFKSWLAVGRMSVITDFLS